MIDSFKKTKEILKKNNIVASKRFGQNFLIADNVLDNIVKSSSVTKEDLVIEIGPGLGNLTEYLLKKSAFVVCIELDDRMSSILDDRFKKNDKFKLIRNDVLKIELDKLVSEIEAEYNESKRYEKVKVVANLPYYITTPIIFKLLQESDRINDITIMVQKEVAERMVASPRSKDYGILSIMTQYLSKSDIKIIVPNTAFIPSPNVSSAVIKLEKIKRYKCKNEVIFFDLIHKAFSQRRKKVSNSLESSKFMGKSKEEIKEFLRINNIGENARAEEIAIEKYIEIADSL